MEQFYDPGAFEPGYSSFGYRFMAPVHTKGLHPFQSKSSIRLSEGHIQQYLLNDPLIFEIDPILSELKELANDCGHLVVLTDPQGTIVKIDGDAQLRDEAEKK